MFALRTTLLGLVALFGAVSNADVVQDDWVSPTLPDERTTLTVGTTFQLQWLPTIVRWFSNYASDADPTNCDLWVVAGDGDEYRYQIATGINVNTTLTYSWNVNVPASDIAAISLWRFRFRRNGFTYAVTGGEIASPGFIMQAGSRSSTVTTTTTTSTRTTAMTGTSATATTTFTTSRSGPASATSSPTGTTTPLPSSGSSSLSGGAIGGIVIGAVAVIAIVVVAVLLYKRRRRDTYGSPPAPTYAGPHPPNSAPYTYSSVASPMSQYSKHPHVGVGAGANHDNREYYKPPTQQMYPAEMPAYQDGNARMRYNELQ